MFKKLHAANDESSYTLNQNSKAEDPSYKKGFVKSGNNKKIKNASYGEKFRKKNNLLAQLPDLEIVESDTFIFQGRLASVIEGGSSLLTSGSEKHGEGVMFLKNGTLIVGFWDHGLLHGRALIFTPFGGRTIAEFYNDKLVVCATYYDNKIDGQKIIYDASEQMWVGSKYSEEAKSFKIIHVEKGKRNELPDFLKMTKSTDLSDLYEEFANQRKSCMILKEIQFFALTENLTYIGYANQESHPNGLGAIYGKNQFYLGHFRDGSLQCYGRMIFENGQIYQGELLSGVFYGQGVYYNPSKNLSTIMSTNRDQQKVLDEQDGYICIDPQLNYFKYQKNGQTGMIGDSLGTVCEILEKYYARYILFNIFRSYIDVKQPSLDHDNTNSEFGVSENVDDVEESISKAEEEIKRRKAQKAQKQKKNDNKWLNFNSKDSNQPEERSFGTQGYSENDFDPVLMKTFSLDKRQAAMMRNHLAEQSMPPNFQGLNRYANNHDQSLAQEFSKLKLNRNLTSGERRLQNTKFTGDPVKIKENIHPKETLYGKDPRNNNSNNLFQSLANPNRIGEKGNHLSTEEAMTFRNKNLAITQLKEFEDSKVQRRYSEMVGSNVLSPQESVISNLSHKVQSMVNKTASKRKKIFM